MARRFATRPILAPMVGMPKMNMVMGVDSSGFFLRPSAPGLPAIRLRDIKTVGEVSGEGRFGFLGVDLTAATLSLDPDVGIEFRLLDPGLDAADGFIRVGEPSLMKTEPELSVNPLGP